MKIKLLLITLSIALSANAEWELFSKYKHTTLYLDKELIRQDGKDRYLWWLVNDHKNFGSQENYARVNCNSLGFYLLSTIWYDEHFAKKKSIYQPEEAGRLPEKVIYAQPNTVMYNMLKKVCSNNY